MESPNNRVANDPTKHLLTPTQASSARNDLHLFISQKCPMETPKHLRLLSRLLVALHNLIVRPSLTEHTEVKLCTTSLHRHSLVFMELEGTLHATNNQLHTQQSTTVTCLRDVLVQW